MVALHFDDLKQSSDVLQISLIHPTNQPASLALTYKNFRKEGHVKTHKILEKKGMLKT